MNLIPLSDNYMCVSIMDLIVLNQETNFLSGHLIMDLSFFEIMPTTKLGQDIVIHNLAAAGSFYPYIISSSVGTV